MNLNHPNTRRKLANAALFFLALGIWTTVMALLPRAMDQRLSQLEATAKPSVEALQSRNASTGSQTPESTPAPQESQNLANAEPVEAHQVIKNATITNYQAVPEQTDSDPCTTADGTDVCPFPSEGVVANNCLDFGTQVYIADEVYTVHDRMASRYGCDVFDILTTSPVPTIIADVEVL